MSRHPTHFFIFLKIYIRVEKILLLHFTADSGLDRRGTTNIWQLGAASNTRPRCPVFKGDRNTHCYFCWNLYISWFLSTAVLPHPLFFLGEKEQLILLMSTKKWAVTSAQMAVICLERKCSSLDWVSDRVFYHVKKKYRVNLTEINRIWGLLASHKSSDLK